jgi:hypothetical protein
MLGRQARTLILVLALATMNFALGGCRKTDTSGTGTTQKVTLPVVGTDASPLPTPGMDSSPLQP